MKNNGYRMIGLLVVLVLAFVAAVPARAAKFAQVDRVYREGKTLVVMGSVACPSNVVHSSKARSNRFVVTVFEEPIVTGGVCNEPRTPFTLRLAMTGRYTVFVNGQYYYTGEVVKK